MTELFNDGFESGDFLAWTGTQTQAGNTLEVQATIKHTGTYAFHWIVADWNNWARAYKTITGISTIYARLYVRFANFPTNTNYQRILVHEVNPEKYVTTAGVYNNAGTIQWELGYLNAGTTLLTQRGGTAPVVDTWYCVEIKTVISGTVGISTLYVDGVEIFSQTNLDNDGQGANIDRIDVGGVYGSALAREGYVDCVVVADAYIGPEGVAAGQPYISRVQRIPGMMTYGGNW